MTSTAFNFSPEELLKQMQANKARSSGPRTDWHSLEAGTNTVRFVSDGRPWVIEYWQHRGVREDGKFCTVIDLDWLMGPEGKDVLEASSLGNEDAELVGRYGDPVKQLRDAILPEDRNSDEYQAYYEAFKAAKYGPTASLGVLATAVVEGSVGLMRLPSGVYNTVWETFETNPVIVSATDGADFVIKKSGKGLGTKYSTALDTSTLNTPVPLDEGASFPSIADGIARDVLDYHAKVKFVRRNYGQFIPDGFMFGGEAEANAA